MLVGVLVSVPQEVNKYKYKKVRIDTTILHSNNSFTPNGLNHVSFIKTLVVQQLNEHLYVLVRGVLIGASLCFVMLCLNGW